MEGAYSFGRFLEGGVAPNEFSVFPGLALAPCIIRAPFTPDEFPEAKKRRNGN